MDKGKLFLEDHVDTVDKIADSFYVKHFQPSFFSTHHHKKYQFTYIEGGIAVLFTEGKSYFIPPRHYVWIPAELPHKIVHRSLSTISRTIYVDQSILMQHPFYEKIALFPVNNLLLEMIIYTETMQGAVAPNTKAYKFIESLILLLPDFANVANPIIIPTSDNDRMVEILKYIQENIDVELQLITVAKRFGISARTLNRLMESEMQITFYQYLKMTRIARSVEYLLQTDKNINEIALSVGYQSVAAYSNVFYQFTGKRPTDFRNLISR